MVSVCLREKNFKHKCKFATYAWHAQREKNSTRNTTMKKVTCVWVCCCVHAYVGARKKVEPSRNDLVPQCSGSMYHLVMAVLKSAHPPPTQSTKQSLCARSPYMCVEYVTPLSLHSYPNIVRADMEHNLIALGIIYVIDKIN